MEGYCPLVWSTKVWCVALYGHIHYYTYAIEGDFAVVWLGRESIWIGVEI